MELSQAIAEEQGQLAAVLADLRRQQVAQLPVCQSNTCTDCCASTCQKWHSSSCTDLRSPEFAKMIACRDRSKDFQVKRLLSK